jgi:hypothetical protein
LSGQKQQLQQLSANYDIVSDANRVMGIKHKRKHNHNNYHDSPFDEEKILEKKRKKNQKKKRKRKEKKIMAQNQVEIQHILK